MDILSYANDLPEKEKKWLNSFVEEYVGANFNHKGTKLHKTKELRKSCYDRNNARNRDVLTAAKATGTAVVFSAMTDRDERQDNLDDVIDALDKHYNLKSWED